MSINGLLVFDHHHKYGEEFYKIVPEKLANGELKYTEDATKGLENGGEAILEVQKGVNTAKKIIIVADD